MPISHTHASSKSSHTITHVPTKCCEQENKTRCMKRGRGRKAHAAIFESPFFAFHFSFSLFSLPFSQHDFHENHISAILLLWFVHVSLINGLMNSLLLIFHGKYFLIHAHARRTNLRMEAAKMSFITRISMQNSLTSHTGCGKRRARRHEWRCSLSLVLFCSVALLVTYYVHWCGVCISHVPKMFREWIEYENMSII